MQTGQSTTATNGLFNNQGADMNDQATRAIKAYLSIENPQGSTGEHYTQAEDLKVIRSDNTGVVIQDGDNQILVGTYFEIQEHMDGCDTSSYDDSPEAKADATDKHGNWHFSLINGFLTGGFCDPVRTSIDDDNANSIFVTGTLTNHIKEQI